MADNTTLNLGVGGDVYASDDIGSVKFQRTKMTLGADGVNAGDVSASNPIPSKLTDGTNSVAVKAASTAPLATDPSLVVTLSPNSPPAATAGNKSNNGGVPGATNLGVLPVVATAATPAYTEGNQTALSADLSGSVRVLASGSKPNNGGGPGATNFGVLPVVANAAAPTYTEGNQAALSTDLAGSLRVATLAKATYRSAITGLVAAAAATDIFTIIGSATKTVKITQIRVSGVQTASTINDVQIVKRSTADTGGVSSAPAVVALDTASAAGTAVTAAYTANPTQGTLVGVIDTVKLMFDKPVATSGSQVLLLNYGMLNGQPITLRGVAQLVAVNLNGQTLSGSSINAMVEWTEE